MDPSFTPTTFAPAAKFIAQQTFQAGKARMRTKPTSESRMAAYVRFQDAAVAVISLIYMAVSDVAEGPDALDAPVSEGFLANLEERSTRMGQALRELFIVASSEVAQAAQRVAQTLGPLKNKQELEAIMAAHSEALNEFTHAVRVDLRYELPYRTRRWQFRRPARPE